MKSKGKRFGLIEFPVRHSLAIHASSSQLSRVLLVSGKNVAPKVNLEVLARELGCIEPWEAVEKP
jgi:hypothetical protein